MGARISIIIKSPSQFEGFVVHMRSPLRLLGVLQSETVKLIDVKIAMRRKDVYFPN